MTLKADRGQSYSVLNSKTQSKLFRMLKQDVGISFEMLMEMLNDYEKELRDPDVAEARK